MNKYKMLEAKLVANGGVMVHEYVTEAIGFV
jgi:hypothetical protein